MPDKQLGGSRSHAVALVRSGQHVASRPELLAVGVSSATIGRRVASGEWQRLFPGVYLLGAHAATFDHKIAAVQKWSSGRAVFSHYTAAYLQGLIGWQPLQIEIVVGPDAGVRSTPLCRVRRTARPIASTGDPARTVLEHTALDLIASVNREEEVLEILIRSFQKRMDRGLFLEELAARYRMKNRAFIQRLLEFTPEGVESHLELGYHHDVERAHGLPRAVRQKWEQLSSGWIRTDAWYSEYHVRVELDGQLAHPGRATDDDITRDNQVRIKLDEITLRYRWRHVSRTPCETAAQVAAALSARGWQGAVTRCSPRCRAPELAAKLGRPAS